MSSIWLERLKASKNQKPLSGVPTEATKPPSVGFVGTQTECGQFFDSHVDAWTTWNERAAILEFEGGMTRSIAERTSVQMQWRAGQ